MKRILRAACVYFTVIAFVHAAVVYIQFKTTADGGFVSSLQMIMIFFFSLTFAAANGLLRGERPSRALRILLHALITATAFYVFMILPAGIAGATALTGLFIYLIVYTAAALTYAAVTSRSKSKKNREAEYTSIFSKK